MKKLIKNGDIILNGKQTRYQAEKQAFEKLETIEELMHHYKIKDLSELVLALCLYRVCSLKMEDKLRKEKSR